MNYVGIDYHKAYSMVAAMNERGQLLNEARIPGNSPVAFAQFFQSLKGPTTAVLEGTRNWGYLYDLLHEMEPVEQVQLANAYKLRVIAEAQVKTDQIDARALAHLLRGDLIPQLHVPSPKNRCRKNVLRQRVFWVRRRTMIRNRVHPVVERQRDLSVPVLRDLFGKRGTDWLKGLPLADPDATLLRQDLVVMEKLNEQLKELDRMVVAENRSDPVRQSGCKVCLASGRSLPRCWSVRLTESIVLDRPASCVRMRGWHRRRTPAGANATRANFSINATAGCAGP